jgi:hypothetical protein
MRNFASWKYKVIKTMRARAITFQNKAETIEEKEAWNKVVSWFDSFYNEENRTLSGNRVIELHEPKECFEVR